MNKIILFLGFLIFTGCINQNNLMIDNEKFKAKKVNTFDGCTNFSYISNVDDQMYGKLFIEYIDLDFSCTWTGFSRGYFDDLFKSTLKLRSMKAIERVDYKNYEFSTYLINDTYYMNLIYKFGAKEDTFIIDYNGKYFDELIKGFIPEYKNISIDKQRFNSNYNESLVDMNILKGYFAKEGGSFDFMSND